MWESVIIISSFTSIRRDAVDLMSLHHDEELSDESDDNVMTSVPKPSSGQQVSNGCSFLSPHCMQCCHFTLSLSAGLC